MLRRTRWRSPLPFWGRMLNGSVGLFVRRYVASFSRTFRRRLQRSDGVCDRHYMRMRSSTPINDARLRFVGGLLGLNRGQVVVIIFHRSISCLAPPSHPASLVTRPNSIDQYQHRRVLRGLHHVLKFPVSRDRRFELCRNCGNRFEEAQ